MPLPTVKEQLADKIALEESLKPKLREFFDNMNDDIELIWSATGRLPDFDEYRMELVALLRNHYRKVADKFGYLMEQEIEQRIREELAKVDEDGYTEEDLQQEQSRVGEVVMLALLLYISTHSIRQAEQIIASVIKQYETVAAKVIAARAEENPTRAEVAAEMREEVESSQDSKIDAIAVTETENVAENSKILEATAVGASALLLLALFGRTANPDSIVKVWNTILDGRERPHHNAAHGQARKLIEPFIVNGQQLMYPGDNNMGATPDNLVNCRCTATFSLQK